MPAPKHTCMSCGEEFRCSNYDCPMGELVLYEDPEDCGEAHGHVCFDPERQMIDVEIANDYEKALGIER